METYIVNDLRVMITAVFVGIILGAIYALISLLRFCLKTGIVLTAITDVIFGILAAIVIFAFTFLFNNGILRAYIIISMLLGIILPLYGYKKLRSLRGERITKRKDWRHTSSKRFSAKREKT